MHYQLNGFVVSFAFLTRISDLSYLVHKLVQPVFDKKNGVSRNFTRNRVLQSSETRSSGKHFSTSIHPDRKTCVVFVYRQSAYDKQ